MFRSAEYLLIMKTKINPHRRRVSVKRVPYLGERCQHLEMFQLHEMSYVPGKVYCVLSTVHRDLVRRHHPRTTQHYPQGVCREYMRRGEGACR